MDPNLDLLFGVLALQADLITADQFAEACTARVTRKHTPLADLLAERGWLNAADRADVQRLVERKLRKHGGDVRASLAEAAGPSVRQSLAGVPDPDLRATLHDLVAAPAVPPSTTDYVPEKRDRYTLIRLHAQGGIGQVWLARDEDLGREVALKELRPEQLGHPAVVARFVEEARIAAQLQHPGIVPVHALAPASAEQAPFYTMKFIRGRTLADACARYHERRRAGKAGPLELRELLGAFVTVCQAVAYAHSRKVIHRDLKTANVALGDYGEVLVLDFGLSKVIGPAAGGGPAEEEPASVLPVSLPQDESRPQTLQGQVLGTPNYMAPEQAQGRLREVNERSDIYGLGAILYEILTGAPPFSGRDTWEILKRVVNDPPVPPRRRARSVPAPLQAICLKALARQPARRYASATDVADEVRRFLADEPVRAYPEPWLLRLRRWLDRHRIAVSAAAAALHGVLWLAIFGWIVFCAGAVRESFANVDMRLPWSTVVVLGLSRPLIEHPYVSLGCLAGFVVLDCWILQRLSRSPGSRVLREMWSGLVVLVPSLLLCLVTVACITPYLKVVEGVTRTTHEADRAAARERRRFDGTWKLVGGERSGQALAEKDLGGGSFSFDDRRFTWATEGRVIRGTYALNLRQRPQTLGLSYWDGPQQQWVFQSGVYEFEGDRLRICLALPNALGDDLPAGFSTKGNRCTLYTFQRAGTNR